MRTVLSLMVVLVTAILVAGCDESPTSGGNPLTSAFTVTLAVEGEQVTVVVDGGTKKYIIQMGCYAQDPNTGAVVWGTSSNRFDDVGPGTYVLMEDRSLHNYDRTCGRGTRKVRIREVLTVGVPIEHLYDVTLGGL